MLFVLSLAGLALLIVVLALGLDLVQGGPRRRAMAAASPAAASRQEPLPPASEPSPSGAMAAPAAPAGATDSRLAPAQPAPRRRAARATPVHRAVPIRA